MSPKKILPEEVSTLNPKDFPSHYKNPDYIYPHSLSYRVFAEVPNEKHRKLPTPKPAKLPTQKGGKWEFWGWLVQARGGGNKQKHFSTYMC